MKNSQKCELPLFKMKIDGAEHWLPLTGAGEAYNCGWMPVEIGGLVLEGAGIAREITEDERHHIVQIANEYSGNK